MRTKSRCRCHAFMSAFDLASYLARSSGLMSRHNCAIVETTLRWGLLPGATCSLTTGYMSCMKIAYADRLFGDVQSANALRLRCCFALRWAANTLPGNGGRCLPQIRQKIVRAMAAAKKAEPPNREIKLGPGIESSAQRTSCL